MLASLCHRKDELIRVNYGTFRGFVRHALADLEFVLGRIDDFVCFDPQQVQRLVFVCLGNINRSAFADWVARSEGVKTSSFGLSTSTGAPAYEMAIKTAPHFGIDLTKHLATDMCDYQYKTGDLLLAMEIRHVHQLLARGIPRDAIVLLGAWSTPKRIHLHDPHTLSAEYFQTCFTLIYSAVMHLAAILRKANSPCMQS